MKYGEVNLGQVEAAINILGGEEGLHKLLSGELKAVPQELVVLLVPDGSYSAEVLPLGDPFVLYKEYGDYHFFHGFQYEILPEAKSVRETVRIGEAPRFRLAIGATGERILSERSNAVWTATEFCAWLPLKVERMQKGKGELRADEAWSGDYFLVKGVNDEVHVVHVRWRSNGSNKCDLYSENLDRRLDVGATFASRA